MIKYQLICDQSHEFEGWFQSSVAYDEQAASGLLCCPICDSDQVKRALMALNIASANGAKQRLISHQLLRPMNRLGPDQLLPIGMRPGWACRDAGPGPGASS